ncbi:MAG: hypothetical protein ACI30R_08720 [Sodaliphilus sp.]
MKHLSVDLPQPTLYRGSYHPVCYLQAALRLRLRLHGHHNTPSPMARGRSIDSGSKLRSGCAFACMDTTIRHLRWPFWWVAGFEVVRSNRNWLADARLRKHLKHLI